MEIVGFANAWVFIHSQNCGQSLTHFVDKYLRFITEYTTVCTITPVM